MSDKPAAGVKACSVCGLDVSSKPRVKNGQGVYFCRECAAKKQAELSKKVSRSVETPSAADDAEMMSKLISGSVSQAAESCPACRRPWKSGAVVCTSCGFSKQTGGMVGTQVKEPEIVKGPKVIGGRKARGRSVRIDIGPVPIFVGLLVILGPCFALLLGSDHELAGLAAIPVLIFIIAYPITMAVISFMETRSPLSSLLMLICGLYSIYYGLSETESPFAKAMTWAQCLFLIPLAILKAQARYQ